MSRKQIVNTLTLILWQNILGKEEEGWLEEGYAKKCTCKEDFFNPCSAWRIRSENMSRVHSTDGDEIKKLELVFQIRIPPPFSSPPSLPLSSFLKSTSFSTPRCFISSKNFCQRNVFIVVAPPLSSFDTLHFAPLCTDEKKKKKQKNSRKRIVRKASSPLISRLAPFSSSSFLLIYAKVR